MVLKKQELLSSQLKFKRRNKPDRAAEGRPSAAGGDAVLASGGGAEEEGVEEDTECGEGKEPSEAEQAVAGCDKAAGPVDEAVAAAEEAAPCPWDDADAVESEVEVEEVEGGGS